MNRGETGRRDGVFEVERSRAMRRRDRVRRFVRRHPHLLATPVAALATWFALALS